MKSSLLLTCLIIANLYVSAQSSFISQLTDTSQRYYVINVQQARVLAQKDNRDTLLSKILSDKHRLVLQLKDLKPGLYLHLSISDNQLKMRVHAEANLRMNLVPTFAGNSIYFFNKQGQLVQPDSVKINDQLLQQNEHHESVAYQPKEGAEFIEAIYRGEHHFFELRNNKPGHYSSPASAYRPFLWINKYYFNPGDTLKFKSFIYDGQKSIADTAVIAGIYSGRQLIKSLGTIKAYRQGAFQGEIRLLSDDKIKFGERYQLRLSPLSNRGEVIGSEDFAFSKAKRKSYVMNIETPQSYISGDSLQFKVSLQDLNNFPVTLGKLSYSLFSWRGFFISDPVLNDSTDTFSPDTLISQKPVKLSPSGINRINIPASLLSNTRLSMVLQVTFIDPEGKENTVRRWISLLNQLDISWKRLSNDSVRLHTVSRKSIPLFVFIRSGEHWKLIKQGITPFSLPLQRNTQYGYSYNLKQKPQPLYIYARGVTADATRKGDSVSLTIVNPERTHYQYLIFESGKCIEQAWQNGPSLVKKWQAKGPVNIYVKVENEQWTQKMELPYKDRELSLSITAPENSAPGKLVDIQIRATDKQDRPVPNVDVTAASTDNAIKDRESSQSFLKKVPAHTQSNPKSGMSTDVVEKGGNMNFVNKSDLRGLFYDFGLETNKAYQLLYSDSLTIHAEPAANKLTQFSLALHQNGKAIPPVLIYVDGLPVYYLFSSPAGATSFPITKGRHTIGIRTSDKYLELSNIQFEDAHRTFIGLNIDARSSGNIRVEARPDSLTPTEIASIQKHIIYTGHRRTDHWGNVFISDGHGYQSYPLDQFSESPWLGPLARPANLSYYQINNQKGIGFDVSQKRKSSVFGDELTSKAELDSALNSVIKNNFDYIGNYPYGGKNNVAFYLAADDTSRIVGAILFPIDKDAFDGHGIYRVPWLSGIRSGSYMLLIIRDDMSYLLRKVIIKNGGTTLLYVGSKNFKKKDLFIDSLISRARQNAIKGASFEPTGKVNAEAISSRHRLSGTVRNARGERLRGAYISLPNQSGNTLTDINGRFSLMAPTYGTLRCMFPGYETKELKIENIHGEVSLVLKPKSLTNLEKFFRGGDKTVHDFASIESGRPIEELKVGYSGQKTIPGENPESDISNSKDSLGYAEDAYEKSMIESASTIRKHFADTAFWIPDLRTDKNGLARFSFKLPDNITSWQTYFAANDESMRTAWEEKTIHSYKSLSATIATPLYLLQGDSATSFVNINSRRSSPTNLSINYIQNNQKQSSALGNIQGLAQRRYSLTARESTPIHLTVQLLNNTEVVDQEERDIPVYPISKPKLSGSIVTINPQQTYRHEGTTENQQFFVRGLNTENVQVAIKALSEYPSISLPDSLLHVLSKMLLVASRQSTLIRENIPGQLKDLQRRIQRPLLEEGFSADRKELASIELLTAIQEQAGKMSLNFVLNKDLLIKTIQKKLSGYNPHLQLKALKCLLLLGARLDYKSLIDELQARVGKQDREYNLFNLRMLEVKALSGQTQAAGAALKLGIPTFDKGIYWQENESFSWEGTYLAYTILRRSNAHQSRSFETTMRLNELLSMSSDPYQQVLYLKDMLPLINKKMLALNDTPKTVEEVNEALKTAKTFRLTNLNSQPISLYKLSETAAPSRVSDQDSMTLKASFSDTHLIAGNTSRLKVSLKLPAAISNAKIQVDLPAGVEISEQGLRRFKYGRENRSVIMDIKFLKSGTHVFEIPVNLRFPGKYTMNTATIWLQNAPSLRADTNIRQIEISAPKALNRP